MFDKIRSLFHREPPISCEAAIEQDLEEAGNDLDSALYVYSQLLENDCRDSLIRDAAYERIADLQEKYQQLKRERAKLENDESKWSA